MTCLRSIAFITDSDRGSQQMIKEHLDAIAYPLGFFREYDESNEVFAPRLLRAFPGLKPAVAQLQVWPCCWMRCSRRRPRDNRGSL